MHHIHFKMESLNDVLSLIQPGVWMESVDLKSNGCIKFFLLIIGRVGSMNITVCLMALPRLLCYSQKCWSNLLQPWGNKAFCLLYIWITLTSKGTHTLIVSTTLQQHVFWLLWGSKSTLKICPTSHAKDQILGIYFRLCQHDSLLTWTASGSQKCTEFGSLLLLLVPQ